MIGFEKIMPVALQGRDQALSGRVLHATVKETAIEPVRLAPLPYLAPDQKVAVGGYQLIIVQSHHRGNAGLSQNFDDRWRKMVIYIVQMGHIRLEFGDQSLELAVGLGVGEQPKEGFDFGQRTEVGRQVDIRNKILRPRRGLVARIGRRKEGDLVPMGLQDSGRVEIGALGAASQIMIVVYQEYSHLRQKLFIGKFIFKRRSIFSSEKSRSVFLGFSTAVGGGPSKILEKSF